jgi:glucose/arabinose dehydrogenase
MPSLASLVSLVSLVSASVFVLGAGLLGLSSCDETLPREMSVATPAPLAPEWGLDARPVSPTCRAGAKPAAVTAPNARVSYVPLTTAPLANATEIIAHGGRYYVLDRSGVIRSFTADGTTSSVVLDISSQVELGYDAGLVTLAFHPKFAQNGYVYVAYTARHPTQPPPAGVASLSVLARFESKDGGLTIDKTTEKRLLVRDQPGPNHQGNKAVFGPDGFLYFAMGEGGQDPRAQDKNLLFGKIIRIDVDNGDPYAIPPTNPFASGGGAPEVYAYGFRNPWRFSFDPPTGDLWVGDVGALGWEEIDRVVAGGNYGWPIREGNTCYLAATCNTAGLIDPLVVHSHTEASAIIGGFVYRGTAIPSLAGKYVYADYISSNFWAVDTNVANPVPQRLDTGLDRVGPTSISVDEKGELIFVTPSRAFRLAPPASDQPEIAAKLSDTGCVDKADPTKPAPGLFAYDVNVPQWMDGAVGERYLSVPAEAQLALLPGAALDAPVGSIAMRTLRREGKRVETQLLVHRPDASWDAYTYAWSADQKDAVLATKPVSIALPSGKTHEVRPGECVGCHDAHAHDGPKMPRPLALTAAQLDHPGVDYGNGRTGNPLTTLTHLNMVSAPIAPESYFALASPSGFDLPERRARAYLHGNCAFCHDGTADFANFDLRAFVPLNDTRACAFIRAGKPEESPLVASMRKIGPGHMPPIGSTTVDERGVDLLSTWIKALPACP